MLRTYGRRTFDFGRRVAVMAILNRTPDSFYDRGANFGFGAAVAAGERALAEGADWLDVGGVKAGPGPEVTEAEELDRVVPLIEALRRTDAVLSVDTFGQAWPAGPWPPGPTWSTTPRACTTRWSPRRPPRPGPAWW